MVAPSAIEKAIAAKPSEWNSGAPIACVSRGRNGHLAEQRAELDERLRLGAGGALRRARRAGGEDDHARVLARLGRRASCRPVGRDALELLLEDRALDGVLVVADQDLGPLALGDLLDLPRREVRVEQDQPRADLGRAERRVEEAAVVADQDRDAVARADAARAQLVGDGVGALVELLCR